MDLKLAFGAPKSTSTLISQFQALASANDCDQVDAAAAYVTVAGVNDVLDVVGRTRLAGSRWLIGLDDAISQPGAIELLMKAGANVRIASFSGQGARFHAKIVHLTKGGNSTKSALAVGSMNVTRAALSKNVETASFLTSKSSAEFKVLKKAFDDIWMLGRSPSKQDLDDYRKLYKRAAPLRAKLEAVTGGAAKPPKNILDTDDASMDPSLAQTCWIECGAVTALGKELEIKAEQGLFFGLSRNGGPPKTFDFAVSDGSKVPLRLKYQGNHMWRVQMNPSVPEVAAGLRPVLPGGGLGRSPHVAVFKRTSQPSLFELEFLLNTSPAFKALVARSAKHGTSGRTMTGPSGRRYGWC